MTAAFIPVRGGSKSIPLKNIKIFNGKPLVYWTIKAAQDCVGIDKIYIATDSEQIKACVSQFSFPKVEVISRSPDSATDTAATELAMLEFASKYDFDTIVLIQATSPLLTEKDLDRGMEVYREPGVDSVLSVVRQKRFCWGQSGEGYVQPLNYDYRERPRRQEFEGFLVENGAFYITGRKGLLDSGCRLSGQIKAVEMSEDTYYEIDEPGDWLILEKLMRQRRIDKHGNIPDIKMFLTDCDGCLTDGGMYYTESGDEFKKFNTKDGMAFELLKKRGIVTGIVTGENRSLVRKRAQKLQLDICESGIKDKLNCIQNLCREYGISMQNVLYIGDDINDREAIAAVGYGCCTADACDEVKAAADYISEKNGGDGVIREIAELFLKNVPLFSSR